MSRGNRRSKCHRELGAVTFLAMLALTTLSWACATTSGRDSTEQPEVREDLEPADVREDLEGSGIQEAVRRELHLMIIDDAVRHLDGMPGAVISCREEQDCARWNAYAGALLGMAERAPRDRYVQGQVVYSLVRGERHDLALIVLEACQATEWWCRALQGFTLAESGRVAEAEAAFDQALLLMPEEALCEWNDLSPLVSRDSWLAYEGSSCLERLERLEEFWWLADPAWAVPGNDRRVEHYNRMAWATLHDDALTMDSGDGRVNDGRGHNEAHHVEVVRHGMDFHRWDARWGRICDWPTRLACFPCGDILERRQMARDAGVECCAGEWPFPWCVYTPDGQPYRVIPEERALLDPFHASADDWPLEPDGVPEHYVSQWGALIPMGAQVAFFERRDSLVVVAAAEVPDDPAFRGDARPAAVLFLQTDPAAPPVTADAAAQEGRWLFRVTAPRRRYVVGIEAVAAGGVARARFGHGLPHDPAAPLRLSDLLLYTLDGSSPPDSLDAAVPLMKGGHRWSQGDVMGVFLEVYGPPDATSFPVSVELERERGGLARLGEILGIGGDKPVNVRWVDAGDGGRFALSFTVNLGEISEGDYTLRVSVVGPGMSPAMVEKSIQIVDAGG